MDLPACSFSEHEMYKYYTSSAINRLAITDRIFVRRALQVAKDYKFSGYMHLNEHVFRMALQRDYEFDPKRKRPKKATKKSSTQKVLLLNELILKLPSVIQKPTTVYRYFFPDSQHAAREMHSIGSTVVQTTFWSTTCLPQVSLMMARDDTCCFLELKLPAGYPVLYIDALVRPSRAEMEFLLAPLDKQRRWCRWLVANVRRRIIRFNALTPYCYKQATMLDHRDCLNMRSDMMSIPINIITLIPTI